jgi:hypothetical protein
MTVLLTPRRRLSLSRLKYLAAACVLAIITYNYGYHGLTLTTRLGSLKPRDAAGNSTLGVRFLVYLPPDSSNQSLLELP